MTAVRSIVGIATSAVRNMLHHEGLKVTRTIKMKLLTRVRKGRWLEFAMVKRDWIMN